MSHYGQDIEMQPMQPRNFRGLATCPDCYAELGMNVELEGKPSKQDSNVTVWICTNCKRFLRGTARSIPCPSGCPGFILGFFTPADYSENKSRLIEMDGGCSAKGCPVAYKGLAVRMWPHATSPGGRPVFSFCKNAENAECAEMAIDEIKPGKRKKWSCLSCRANLRKGGGYLEAMPDQGHWGGRRSTNRHTDAEVVEATLARHEGTATEEQILIAEHFEQREAAKAAERQRAREKKGITSSSDERAGSPSPPRSDRPPNPNRRTNVVAAPPILKKEKEKEKDKKGKGKLVYAPGTKEHDGHQDAEKSNKGGSKSRSKRH